MSGDSVPPARARPPENGGGHAAARLPGSAASSIVVGLLSAAVALSVAALSFVLSRSERLATVEQIARSHTNDLHRIEDKVDRLLRELPR